MINIPRKPLTAEYKVNQIGHYKELMAGAGSKIFKVNSAGLFMGASSWASAPFRVDYNGNANITGTITATSGTFRGTIYAEAGAIEGDLVVSGSLYSDTGGYRTRLKDGKVEYLYNNSRKAYIMASDNGTGIQVSTSGIIYFTKSSGVPIAQLGQNGEFNFNADTSYIQWAGGRKISVGGNNLVIDGHLLAGSASLRNIGADTSRWENIYGNYIKANTFFSCQGSEGRNWTSYGLIRQIRDDGGQLQAKYTEFTFKGGIITDIDEKSSWVDQN